jgi:hypothetical protein
MKKVLLSLLLCCVSIAASFAQTALSATGDGGFENGTTLAANGWTVVNAGTNAWYVGTAVAAFAGTKCVYISNNSGTANAYGTGTIQTSHFYRDIVIPAGASAINLSFQYRGKGELGWDRIAVFTAPTTVTPVAGVPQSTSSATNPAISGATLIFYQTAFQTAYTLVSQTLPNTLAGTTVRLIFTWQNDGSGGTQPPAAIDNISLTYTPGVPCAGTPTPGTVSATQTSGCANYSSTLTLAGASTSTGIAYQWQSSPDNSAWTDVTAATNTGYTAAVTTNIYYRCQLICTGFGSTAYTPGLQLTLTPPAYATLPFTESFEPLWINACNTGDAPNNFWRNTPATGNNSWRRDDDAPTTNTGAWGSANSYPYFSGGSTTSPGGSASAHSARFHQGASNALNGKLDLYVNLPAGTKQINYDYISGSGTTGATNSIQLQVSTDGGATHHISQILSSSSVWPYIIWSINNKFQTITNHISKFIFGYLTCIWSGKNKFRCINTLVNNSGWPVIARHSANKDYYQRAFKRIYFA